MERCWAEIDLDKIQNNIKTLRRSPDFMAVVKANGYGHGAVQVARVALEAGATWLGVALPEEGIELRNAGIETPILVLSEPFELDDIIKYRLTPVVYTRKTIIDLPREYSIHLKVDTGMHRVGCQPDKASSLVDLIYRRGLNLQGLMTHLAGVNDLEQLQLFDSLIKDLQVGENVLVHAANSLAVKSGVGKYDMDRCGHAMYEGSMKLKSRVRFLQRAGAGEGISYGWNYSLERTGYVAIIPIGYADGVSRNLKGTEVLINNSVRAVIVSVTMDQTILELGRNAYKVSIGDEVDLLIHEWPERLGTISYEVLCGIRERVPRHYRQLGK